MDLPPSCRPGKHKCFAEVVPTMQQQLRDIIPHVKIAPTPTGIIMTKGESLRVVSNAFKVGLGWDQVGNAVDLDATLYALWRLFAGRGVLLWCSQGIRAGPCTLGRQSLRGRRRGRRVNRRRSQRIPPQVQYVAAVVNCYDNVPLSNVRNAYIRLCSGRWRRTGTSLPSWGQAGFRMATLYRGRSGGWMIKLTRVQQMEARGRRCCLRYSMVVGRCCRSISEFHDCRCDRKDTTQTTEKIFSLLPSYR